MDVRQALHKALVDGIPEVDKRVYPIIMPQDTKKNSIVYTFIGKNDMTGVCGVPAVTDNMVQIDVFAHTYAQSVELKTKVEKILRDTFTVSGLSNYEMYEDITVKYRQILDFQIKGYVDPDALVIHIVNHGVNITNHGNQVIN